MAIPKLVRKNAPWFVVARRSRGRKANLVGEGSGVEGPRS